MTPSELADLLKMILVTVKCECGNLVEARTAWTVAKCACGHDKEIHISLGNVGLGHEPK